jgi:hypothetical protein
VTRHRVHRHPHRARTRLSFLSLLSPLYFCKYFGISDGVSPFPLFSLSCIALPCIAYSILGIHNRGLSRNRREVGRNEFDDYMSGNEQMNEMEGVGEVYRYRYRFLSSSSCQILHTYSHFFSLSPPLHFQVFQFLSIASNAMASKGTTLTTPTVETTIRPFDNIARPRKHNTLEWCIFRLSA